MVNLQVPYLPCFRSRYAPSSRYRTPRFFACKVPLFTIALGTVPSYSHVTYRVCTRARYRSKSVGTVPPYFFCISNTVVLTSVAVSITCRVADPQCCGWYKQLHRYRTLFYKKSPVGTASAFILRDSNSGRGGRAKTIPTHLVPHILVGYPFVCHDFCSASPINDFIRSLLLVPHLPLFSVTVTT